MSLTRTLDAASECLALAEVKNQLRVTTTADDDSFRLFIASVRHKVEWIIGQTLITSTWTYTLDAFTDDICLPMGPVQSVTTVAYTDTAGDPQTFTDFEFNKEGRIRPATGFEWPSTKDTLDAVTITYIAGQTNAGQVDEDIKHAMLLIIGAADVGREDTVIGAGVVVSQLKDSGANSLLMPHKKVAV